MPTGSAAPEEAVLRMIRDGKASWGGGRPQARQDLAMAHLT